MPTLEERIAGGLLGLLIGDALGVPYEFHRANEIPPTPFIEFTPPKTFQRAHVGIPPGTWSDDGAQALVLLASLLYCDRFDAEDFGRRLVNWYEWGYMAVDNRVFDVGIQTGAAIRNLMRKVPALEAGGTDEMSNGNGALMRVLPLVLWHRGDDVDLATYAMLQSRVTHGHLRSQVCCALYCLWARRIMQEAAEPWRDAVETLREMWGEDSPEFCELDYYVRPYDLPPGEGSGFVVDSLRSAYWTMQAGDYEQVVKAAVALGRDTDTTACIAGGIAGLRDGVAAIPQRWRDELRGREILEPLLEALLQRSSK
ncbi:MAG TPA: ADP-ribosylglycohydrolase family protein [Blastocatellia bacterium]|nr:ADP-ribosylglycohydrolase family protein [Blastocatellia bacterium]